MTQTFHFPDVRVHIEADRVLTTFASGAAHTLDINAGDNDHYKAIAASCGYPGGDRDFRRYARHHDLTHSWLGAEQGWLSSVLWHEAKGLTYSYGAKEEHHVNCLQRLWADRAAGIEWREKEKAAARDALGEEWHPAFARLAALLDSTP